MSQKNFCKLCGHSHFGLDHIWDASNTETASNNPIDSASNKGAKQRWSREKYNAYMREYMAKRRRSQSEGTRQG